MTLFQIILKILAHFALISTEDKQMLHKDIQQFELEATPDSDDRIKALYGKLHKGIYVRLALPFLFFFGVKYFKDLIADDPLDDFEDED